MHSSVDVEFIELDFVDRLHPFSAHGGAAAPLDLGGFDSSGKTLAK
jgi:hypothetical protein